MERGAEGERKEVVIDVPSGRVRASVEFGIGGRVRGVEFWNVGSWMVERGRRVEIEGDGGEEKREVVVDLAFGGAVFACVDAEGLGLEIVPENHLRCIELARRIKAQLLGTVDYKGAYDIASISFFWHKGEDEETITQRHLVIYGDGQVDRWPCGSGTSARLAALLAQGKLDRAGGGKRRLKHESILGTKFEAWVGESLPEEDGFPGCVPVVRSQAHLVGRMEFWIDPEDPVFPGFVFR